MAISANSTSNDTNAFFILLHLTKKSASFAQFAGLNKPMKKLVPEDPFQYLTYISY
ncbi:hypothetical protein JCM14108_960 [Lentilactobacillus farraginis DSM 18382 = JCM 14108]|uniref:Uncharacterized protein n=1 Tax=Lentilactobacillus farraginis DSM 18382 = JCM 14108 TaxID=1423743 RepID=X0P9W2_9LACO|nr:hypothetical protein JCM14108_960 [Lentilactobacillus farraginis DSM 18382 = JCM 14108]